MDISPSVSIQETIALGPIAEADAHAEATHVAEALTGTAAAHFSASDGYETRVSVSQRGELDCRVSRKDFNLGLTTMLCKGVTGKSTKDFSVRISVDASIPSLLEARARTMGAASIAQHAVTIAVGISIALVVIAVMLISGWLVLSEWFVVVAIAGGGFAGKLVGSWVSERFARKAHDDVRVQRAGADLDEFLQDVASLTDTTAGSQEPRGPTLKTGGPATIVECVSYGAEVLPKADGTCPSCGEHAQRTGEEADDDRTVVRLSAGTRVSGMCCTCGAATERLTTISRSRGGIRRNC